VAAEAARHHRQLSRALIGATVQPSALAYRLRTRLHWDPDSCSLGFYRRRSWQVSAIPECRILSPRLMGARDSLEEQLARSCPEPVDVEWIEDLAGDRAVIALRPARHGRASVDPRWLPDEGDLAGTVAGCHTLSRSGQTEVGWGDPGVIMDLPVRLEAPIGAFFQGNRHLVPWLFQRVGQLLGSVSRPAFDLHAGVGYVAAAVAANGDPPTLQLVEPHRPAARAAARSLPHARVAIGRTAEAFLARRRHLEREVTVLTDPPRCGMSRELRHRLAGWHPQQIVMLACDPATWSRDTAFLLDRGYRLSHLELIDLFPSTHHVEILSILEARAIDIAT
jgi:tRNA/tmRNA/rRNA uracil-C5-methylase (TrmA/RlmC/RlmD family)